MRQTHDNFCVAYADQLRGQGYRIAEEVGVPGGRIDIVRLSRSDRWIELYEIKVRAPEAGFEQLHRYASLAPNDGLKLTLVVSDHLFTANLRKKAIQHGIRLDLMFGYQEQLFRGRGLSLDTWVSLPCIHPTSMARAEELRREWRERMKQYEVAA